MQEEKTKGVLYDFIEKMKPSEISKIRGKMQEASTRDKKLLLKKVAEIENILNEKKVKISLKKM